MLEVLEVFEVLVLEVLEVEDCSLFDMMDKQRIYGKDVIWTPILRRT